MLGFSYLDKFLKIIIFLKNITIVLFISTNMIIAKTFPFLKQLSIQFVLLLIPLIIVL